MDYNEKAEVSGAEFMPINIELIIEKAFEEAFSRALDRVVQSKAEVLFTKALEDGSPLAKKLEEKIEQGFNRFTEEGIQWERKKPGFES
jgi:hypothetical protein